MPTPYLPPSFERHLWRLVGGAGHVHPAGLERVDRLLHVGVRVRVRVGGGGHHLLAGRDGDGLVPQRLVDDADPTGRRPDELVHPGQLPGLVRGPQRGAVLEHDVDAGLEVVAAVDPPTDGALEQLDRGVLVGRVVLQLVGVGPDGVLEHGDAVLVPVDDVEVGRLVQRTGGRVLLLEHLRVLVVDHRLRGVDLLAQQRGHVELLLDEGDTGLRVDARLLESGEQLELVAEAPVADLLAGQARGRGQPRVLPRDLQRAGPLVDLADVGDLRALLARGQRLGHPRDGEVDRAGGQLGLRHDVDAALDDGHVEALLGPEAPCPSPRSSRRTGSARPTAAAA